MDIEYAQNRADELCKRYGIPPVTVKFVSVNSEFRRIGKNHKTFLGQALYMDRVVLIRDGRLFEEMLETLHHELAHFIAITFGDYRHGSYFKKFARELGAFPRAHIGNLAAETRKNQKIASDKARRAKNRKEHPSHTEHHPDCHLCQRDWWK